MITRIFIQSLAIVLFTLHAAAGDPHMLFYELRGPKSLKLDGLTKFDMVTDHSASGTRLRLTKQREEGEFIVYSVSCLLEPGERRRAIIVSPDSGVDPSQVFRLTIPRTPKKADWTKWQRPDYVEKSDAFWTFMHDLKKHDRSTNLPPTCLELRYRVAEWILP
jgi:hypothetical protein